MFRRRLMQAVLNAVSYVFYSAYMLHTDKTTDTVGFTANPCVYQSYYRIRFDYKVTVKTLPPTNNMIFSIQNNGAFTYQLVKILLGTKDTLGIHTGSVDVTYQALKNSGTHMNFIFRPYSGVADFELTNVRVEKVG